MKIEDGKKLCFEYFFYNYAKKNFIYNFFPTSSYSVSPRTSAVADRHRGHYSKHPGQNLPRGHNQIYSHTSAEWSLYKSVQGNLCMTKNQCLPPQ